MKIYKLKKNGKNYTSQNNEKINNINIKEYSLNLKKSKNIKKTNKTSRKTI